MKRILCLWFPNWPIQRVAVANPELKDGAMGDGAMGDGAVGDGAAGDGATGDGAAGDGAIALYALDPRRGQRVLYVSRLARTAGVRPGMSMAEAEALVKHAGAARRLPGGKPSHRPATFVWREHDPVADREMLQQLALKCERFSPLVGLETADHPACLLLEITHSAARLGGEKQLCQQVVDWVRQLKYQCRLAVADTIGTAWAVAHFGDVALGDVALGDVALGDVATPEAVCDQLPRLPIESLRLEADTLTLLHRLGIQRIQELLALPRQALLSRFGAELLTRLDQARGKVPESVVAFYKAPPLEQSYTLEHATSRRDAIEAIVLQLLGRLSEQLHRQQRSVIRLECCLSCEGGKQVEIQTGLYQPTSSPAELTKLLKIQLEQYTLPAAVHGIRVAAAIVSQRTDQQNTLLDDHENRAPQALGQLVNRLSSRLGRAAVAGVQLLAEAEAERSFQYVALTGDGRWTGNRRQRAFGSSATARRLHHAAGWRPLGLKAQPIRLRVVSVAPNGPPVSFSFGNRMHPVAHYWGPERMETGWWRGGLVRRDYYRVQDQSGCRFWVFRDLENGDWFLHGEFV